MRRRAGRRIVRMVDGLELLDLPFRIILDHDLERPQHRHAPLRRPVEHLADAELEHADIDDAVGLGDADALDEFADRRRRHAAPLQPGDGRHARIVPAGDVAVAHEFGQHPLRQQRVGEIEPREFVLMRLRRHRQLVEQPVIERPVVLEFQRADRMRDALDRVRLPVGVVVARIDRPFVAGARMGGVQDAIEHGVAQIDVARGHVDLGAQHAGAVRKLAGLHAAKQIEVFLHRAVAERAVLAGFGQRAAREPDLLLRSGRRHRRGRRGSGPPPSRRAARNNPRHRTGSCPSRSRASARRPGSNRCIPALPWSDWCRRSAGGSGRRKLLRDAEIERDRLGVADMQIAVRLRREPGHDLPVSLGVQIGLDDVANEIAPRLCRHRFCCHSWVPVRESCGPSAKSARPKEGFSYVPFLLYTTAPAACPLCSQPAL